MNKILMELDHSARLKIYINISKIKLTLVFKSIQMTNSPMILKFPMQHDQAAGLQNDKIQPGGEQKWPLYLKIAKAIKSFSSGRILYGALVGPWFFTELST